MILYTVTLLCAENLHLHGLFIQVELSGYTGSHGIILSHDDYAA